MSDKRPHEQGEDVLTPLWDPRSNDRCVVCNRPAGGRAICSDARCAAELAQG